MDFDELERDGPVSRRVEATVPPRVHYALTMRGKSLETALVTLRNWAEINMPAIAVSLRQYDRRATTA